MLDRWDANYDNQRAKIAGYEWITLHSHLDANDLMKRFNDSLARGYINPYWLRGAYDALISLGIVSELGSISAAALVGCNRDAINKAIKAGNLKAKKVDKTYVINPLDLELWDKSANRKRRKKP